jgi:hypothetical protein
MNLDDEHNCYPSQCLASCLETFGNSIFPGNRDFDQICRILSRHSSDSVFSSLYCCDLSCGVEFGNGAGHNCRSVTVRAGAGTDSFYSKCKCDHEQMQKVIY